MNKMYFAPNPKEITYNNETFKTSTGNFLKLVSDDIPSLLFIAKRVALNLEITASKNISKKKTDMTIEVDDFCDIPADGYTLDITANGIFITSSTAAGAFYGVCTLNQIYKQTGNVLPTLHIYDYPDFTERGVMLDISRDKVPTMETLFELVDLLASWKINHFQLYTEHTFKYEAHDEVWKNASPMTPLEIMELDKYCRERFVEFVPNQNSFGHMERWLKYDRYRPLAESPNGGESMWGHFEDPFSLCPTDKKSLEFISELYDKLLPNFSSNLFNIGGDETKELGYPGGRSKELCDKEGVGRVYLDFILKLYNEVTARGKTMLFWGDIIMKYPELIPQLPKDLVALEWGYEYDHPYDENCKKFAASEIPFYVCPGTSTWCSIVGRTNNAIGSINNAAKNGIKNGAIGFLNTAWGDQGHFDPLPVAYLGFMSGAMVAWNAEDNIDDTIIPNLSIHAFNDNSLRIGKVFYDLGNLYSFFSARTKNFSVLWHLLFSKKEDFSVEITKEELYAVKTKLEDIKNEVKTLRCDKTVLMELKFVLKMMSLAVKTGKAYFDGKPKSSLEDKYEKMRKLHRKIWLLRNRIGGLDDSEAKLNTK